MFSGSEAATVAELDSAVAAKKPVIMYWWTPTAAVGKYKLQEVKLPEYTDGCADDPATVACGYPSDPLIKLASAKLEAKNAEGVVDGAEGADHHRDPCSSCCPSDRDRPA